MPKVENEQEVQEAAQPRQHPEKTCFSRVTLTQEIALFLPSAPFRRHVQIFIPADAPGVFIDEDRPTELNPDGTAPVGLPGRNRVYKLPKFQSDQTLDFYLAPGQWLVGAVDDGMVHLALIVRPEAER